MNNIKIYNPKGEVVFSHPPKGYYKKELMGDEYVIFSWNDVRIHNIPVGSYIKYKDIRFTLLEPYLPNMTNELQFKYELKFERFSWRKTPLYFIDGDIKESNFAIDGKPVVVLTHVLRSLKDELGEEYTLSIDENLTTSKSFNFQNESVVSALNKIADEWETEWWLDGDVLHLSKCEKGEQEDLIIGDDIKPPSNSENDDFYTRFVVFGGSRNMAQKYEEGVNISTKTTLKLDKTKYPDSAISISDDIRFTKTLVFEDVYPRSFLEISDVRAEIVDYYGEDGQKVQVGTENGEPVYKTYPVYTIQFKDYTLDPSDVLNGLTPQVKFESGILEGRDFNVEIVSGGLRIKYKDEADIITPNYTLKPNIGDKVVLWNVKMPDKYIKDAQDELERVALKYINDLKLDNTQYTANTNRVKFDRFLDVGQRVRYVKLGYNKEADGTKELYTLDTRILSFQIDLENNREQILVFGNNLVKGNIKELKEDVTNVNDNVALLGEIQNARDTILNVYGRTQQEFSKFVNQFSRMWAFKDIKGHEYAYTPYNVALKGSLVMYANVEGVATPSLFDAFPHDNKTIKRRADGVYYAVGGDGGISKVSISVNDKEYLPDSNGKITIPNYPSRLSHLTNDVGYTTQQWVDSQKYAKVSQLPTRVSQLDNDSGYVTSSVVNGYATQSWSNSRFALKSHKHNWSDITNTPTTLGGYGITDAVTIDTNQSITGVKEFDNFHAYKNNIERGWFNCIVKDHYSAGWGLGMSFINKGKTLGSIAGHGGNGYMSSIRFEIGGVAHELRYDLLNLKGDIIADNLKGVTKVEFKGGGSLWYDTIRDAIIIDGDVLTTGAVTMYGSKGASLPTLFDSFPHDNVTIKRRADGVYYAVGGGGGTSSVSIKLNDRVFKPNSDGQIDLPKYATHLSQLKNDVGYITNVALKGLASESWVRSQDYLRKEGDSKLILSGNQFESEFRNDNWILRNKYTGGGWARNLLSIRDAEDNAYINIGGKGRSQLFDYLYIGRVWNDYNISINPNTKITNILGTALYNDEEIATKDWSNNRFALKLHKHNWSDINNTPTTLGGYGITDAYNKIADYKPIGGANNPTSSLILDNVDGLGGFRFAQTMFYNDTQSNASQLLFGYTSNEIHFRGRFNGEWSSVKQVAFTDSNVASASKLQAPRKLWGQSFDGTQDVSGSMLGVGNVNLSGDIVSQGYEFTGYNNHPRFRLKKDGKNMIIQYYDDYIAMGLGAVNSIKVFENGDFHSPKDLYVGGGVYNARTLAFASSVKITDGFGENILETLQTQKGTTLSLMEESLMLNKDGALLNGKFYLNGCLIECIDGVFYLHGDVVSTGAVTMFAKK